MGFLDKSGNAGDEKPRTAFSESIGRGVGELYGLHPAGRPPR